MCQLPPTVVLVVSDSLATPSPSIHVLQHGGHFAKVVNPGSTQLIQEAEGSHLIVLDLARVATAQAVYHRFKSHLETASLPVLFLLAAAEVGDSALIPLPGDTCLRHPVEAAELISTANVLLLCHRARQQCHQVRGQETAARLEAVGRLAGGVAHDFNNLLTVVNGYSELLLEDEALGEAFRGPLTEVRKAGERAATLTRQLLAFSRKQMLIPRRFDLNETVTGMLDHLRRALGREIEVTFQPGSLPRPVLADPGKVEEALMHLVLDVRESMPHGGRFSLTTDSLEVTTESEFADLPKGAYAILRVTDTGPGLDGDAQARLFEPFFTTRELGRGEGVGLAVVHGIVHQNGGRIDVHSQPGQGTTFTIALPCDPDAALPTNPGHAAQPVARSATILMVEDEAPVRTLVHCVLSREGYSVLEAANHREAEQLCRSTPGQIDLLLTDMTMPDTHGRRLAEVLTQLRPEMKVVLMSGYLDESLPTLGPDRRPVAFLPKPFTREALLGKVRAMLEGR